MSDDKIYSLRCCRDWPCQLEAMFFPGRCGLCGQTPERVFEPYVKEEK